MYYISRHAVHQFHKVENEKENDYMLLICYIIKRLNKFSIPINILNFIFSSDKKFHYTSIPQILFLLPNVAQSCFVFILFVCWALKIKIKQNL